MLRGARDRDLARVKFDQRIAYSTAILLGYATHRPAKMPSFEKAFPDGRPKPVMTPDAMIASMQQWTALFGSKQYERLDMAAIVGALRAVLSLESAAFQSGLKNSGKALADFDQRMKHIGKGMAKAGAALSVIGAGIAMAIKGGLDSADDLSKASQKFGVPIEDLSRLKHAADLSDVSMETLGVSMGQLSKRMAAAMKGGKAAKLFKDLGIQVTDASGAMRVSKDVLNDIADKLAAMPDGAEKTALAMELLGKSGAEMIPLLNGGGEALRQAGIEAEAMGLVIDAKTGKAAENFNDNLSRLKQTLEGLATQIAASMAPALERLSGMAVELAKWFQKLSPATQEWMAIAAGIAVVAGPILIAMGAVVGSLGAVAGALRLMGLAMLSNPVLITIAAVAAGAALIYANWDGISAWFEQTWAAVKDVFVAGWEMISEALLDYSPAGLIFDDWAQVGEWFSTLWADVKTAWEGGWMGILGLMVDYSPGVVIYRNWEGIAAFFADIWVRVRQAFGDGWQRIKDVAALWVDDFLAIGGQIVDGLKAGIMAKWDEMVAWFKGKADGLTASFREWFGIQSPSRVFRAIGQFLTEGLGLGIRDNVPMVHGAMSDVNTAIIGSTGSITDMASDFSDGWKDAFKSFVMGTATAREALSQLANKMADAAQNDLFDLLWGGLDGKSGLGSIFAGLFGFAKGGVFVNGGVSAFAKGGVVSGATGFAMKGGLGVMGEAGPEAIMPLTRGANGKLGVAMQGGAQKVEVEVFVRDDGTLGAIARQAGAEGGRSEANAVRRDVPGLMANYTKRHA